MCPYVSICVHMCPYSGVASGNRGRRWERASPPRAGKSRSLLPFCRVWDFSAAPALRTLDGYSDPPSKTAEICNLQESVFISPKTAPGERSQTRRNGSSGRPSPAGRGFRARRLRAQRRGAQAAGVRATAGSLRLLVAMRIRQSALRAEGARRAASYRPRQMSHLSMHFLVKNFLVKFF